MYRDLFHPFTDLLAVIPSIGVILADLLIIRPVARLSYKPILDLNIITTFVTLIFDNIIPENGIYK